MNSITNPTTPSSESQKKFSIDNYTEEQYNNFGWINYNDVVPFDVEQRAFSNFADYKKNKYQFAYTDKNEVVIPTGKNVNIDTFFLIDKDSDIVSPKVNRILAISKTYTDISDYIRSITNEARKISSNFIQEYVQYGVFNEFNGESYGDYKSLTRKQQRLDGTEISSYSTIKDGSRGIKDDRENQQIKEKRAFAKHLLVFCYMGWLMGFVRACGLGRGAL